MQNRVQFDSNTMTEQENQNHHQDYDNNIGHGAGRFLRPDQLEDIKNAYVENISDTMTGAVAHLIERAFDKGLEADEIVMAIEETGFAPRPSPMYLKKILENWVENGVTVSKIRHYNAVNRGLPWWK